jgi:hypothetical protein
MNDQSMVTTADRLGFIRVETFQQFDTGKDLASAQRRTFQRQ